MEMRNVVAREGREAKNILLYHLSNEDDLNQKSALNAKKPPPYIKSTFRKSLTTQTISKKSPRVRSASTGRDKRSELQARYWALLFGNLQRAINEIYQTVECYENLSSCMETILVLENYIRDFKALAEWFQVSWDYDATPQPQRPQSLAWEIRKSNPAPRLRSRSANTPSPNLSGKSSPCPSYSGKSSPLSGNDDQKSPRKKLSTINQKVSAVELSRNLKNQRLNVREFILSKTSDSESVSDEIGVTHGTAESELTKIPEENYQAVNWNDMVEQEERQHQIQQKLTNEREPEIIIDISENEINVETSDQYAQTADFDDEDLTLQQWRDKHETGNNQVQKPKEGIIANEKIESSAVEKTVEKLNAMENEFLKQNTNQANETIRTTNELSKENPVMAKPEENLIDKKSEEKKVNTIAPLKYSNVVNRPAAASSVSTVASRNVTAKMVASKTIPLRPQTASKCPVVMANGGITRKVMPKIVFTQNRPKSIPMSAPTTHRRQATNTNASRISGPVPSNTANRLANRSKTMIDLGKGNKTYAMVSNKLGTNTNSLSRDSFGSSTSTLRASNDQISNGNGAHVAQRRSEPKSMPTHNDENDGWLTVKAKRRSSLHWANRFNQPTGYASLPTLPLLEEKEQPTKKETKKETKKTIKSTSTTTTKTVQTTTKSSPTSNQQPKSIESKRSKVQQNPSQNEPAKSVKTTKIVKHSGTMASRSTILQRQKSDITGLKLNTLRRQYLRQEKNNKQNSFDANKKLNEHLNEEVESTANLSGLSAVMSDLYASCMDDAKRNIESADHEEIESDLNQKKLLEEQECLERQIRELQDMEIEVDTETDDADCETILDFEESDSNAEMDNQSIPNIDEDDMSLETRYQHLLSDMSSGERIETLATLQAFVSRHPGRAQELHQKLSNPSRRRSLHETLKKYQAKQSRAQEMRELLNKEKALKIQTLLARVEDVKSAKQQLIEEKRIRMEEKLQRYEENRNQFLKHKVRKAHDEEEKLKEIAFIKSLEAQNKRIDMMEMRKEQEVRLQDLEQKRQKQMEEKAAKEAAVERRRMELAKERQMRLEKIDETRREREQRVEQMQEEKEKLRQKIAREKARDREERLQALQAQQQQTTEELQRKIIQKQQESARRHEENIEHIRQRALELSIPSRNVDENGVRTESADRARDDLSSIVSDMSIDNSKAARKKLKKLRQRLAQLSDEYTADLEQAPAYMRRDSSVPKLLAIMRRGGGPQGMERQLSQLARIIAKPEVFDFQCLWLLDGLGVLADIVQKAIEPNTELSRKSLITAIQIYRNACSLCPQIARHAILGNSIVILFDALLHSLQIPDDKTASHPIELSTELMLACTVVLSPSNTIKQPHPKVSERLPDLTSFAVSIGLIDILSRRCRKIRETIENHQGAVLSVLACLGLLTKFADIFTKISNTSKFLTAVKSTELCGTISLLYATVVPVGECIPPRTISLAAATFNLILTLANLDLNTFQTILSQEALSMQFIDVASILLKYCVPKADQKGETQAVIVDLVATLGFFCANNKQNQDLLLSDQSSIIIKCLSKLPKAFDIVVYPTLLTIICDNDGAKSIIGREFDLKCIEEYQNSEMAKKNKMLSVLQSNNKT